MNQKTIALVQNGTQIGSDENKEFQQTVGYNESANQVKQTEEGKQIGDYSQRAQEHEIRKKTYSRDKVKVDGRMEMKITREDDQGPLQPLYVTVH